MSYEGGGGSSASPGIGFPQLAACLLIGYLFFRWYNSSPPPPNTGTEFTSSSTAAVASRRPLSAQDLARLQNRAEIVHGMFPQISLSSIKWELQKNGGSVEITTEKILAQGFLPEVCSRGLPLSCPYPNLFLFDADNYITNIAPSFDNSLWLRLSTSFSCTYSGHWSCGSACRGYTEYFQ